MIFAQNVHLNLKLAVFLVFSRHHNILEKFEKSVTPIILYYLTDHILFSVTFYVDKPNFTAFWELFQDLRVTAAILHERKPDFYRQKNRHFLAKIKNRLRANFFRIDLLTSAKKRFLISLIVFSQSFLQICHNLKKK